MIWKTAALLLVVVLLVVTGCFVMSKPPAAPTEPGAANESQTQFAAGRDGFDAKRAMGYLEAICKIGPRISGTDGMKKQRELIEKHFKDLGATVEYQRFTARQVSRRQPTEMANMIISWHPERARRVILCSHYDTRPIADQEDDRRNWHKPFLSANDGGSGVALLMELGHQMKDLKMQVGVDFVLFDGEEYIFNPSHVDGDHYFFGSEHFAAEYKRGKGKVEYLAAILLDMIAGKTISFPGEAHSLMKAGRLVEEVWKVAQEQKADAFVMEPGPEVQDDHLALNAAGIPAIDIIDFSYPHWHKLSDTPENCSGRSMAQVARVLSAWLQRVK